MEMPVLFLQSLFILLVASHVAYACSCRRLTLEQNLCPEHNRTVVMANAKTNETLLDYYRNITRDPSAPMGRYEMNLEHTFKNGTLPLDTEDGVFWMYFPRQENYCGRIFNISDSYVFVGQVDRDGKFHSDICEMIIPKAVAVGDATIMDFLQGNRQPNC